MSAGAPQRDRSPGYPVLSLREALERLTEFEAHFKRQGARPERAGDAWGIKAKAYTDRIIAALKYFGLLDYQGHGEARSVIVSDDGRRYLRAQSEDTRQEVIAAAALRPKQIARYWKAWGANRPPEAACLDDLILVNGFSETGARGFLKVYDATISFIPAPYTDITGSHGRAERWAGGADAISSAPVAAAPDEAAPAGPDASLTPETPKAPLNEERFVVDEGTVILRFPPALGADSVGDLEAFFALFIRKARRRAADPQRPPKAD